MQSGKPLQRKTPLRRTGFKKKPNNKLAVPTNIYQQVLARDKGCVARGTLPGACEGRIDPHHILRRSQGGPDTVENLISLCRLHHSWVHQNTGVSYELGFLKHSWESHGNSVDDQ